MSSVNKVFLIGNVGQEPEVHVFDNGDKQATLTLATSVKWKDQEGNVKEKTTWHNLVCNNKMSGVVEEYVKKGHKICVIGSIDNYTYNDTEGVTKYGSRVKCYELTMLTSKGSAQSSNPSNPANHPDGGVSDEDDLPF